MSSAPTATSVPAQGSNTTNSPQQNSNRPNGQASRRGGNRGGHNSKDQRGNWGRGRGQRGGRGGGSTGGRDHAPNPHIDAATRSAPPLSPSAIPDRSGVSDSRPIKDAPANVGVGEGERSLSQEDEVEAEVCFICASPVIHNSVAPCNHRTCHICALRLRALYKTRACAHCRTEAKFVIFTDDPTKRYEDFVETDFQQTDDVLGVKYESNDIYDDTRLLLRYNCPGEDCDVACWGWPDLHRHVKGAHQKVLCDLCTRNKKVFTHEHELFTPQSLRKHEKFGDDNPGAIDQSGFKGHPQCGFCVQRFYSDDELYTHCRDKHERCHICDRRNQGRQQQYYQDYNALEEHFRSDHFLCPDQECLEKKFTVFESEMDLKAHQLEAHPNGLTKDARRDARRVDISGFDYRTPHQDNRTSRRERDGRGVGRGRDPNAEPLPASSAQPMRRDEIAYQRQMALTAASNSAGRTVAGQVPLAEAFAARPTGRNQDTIQGPRQSASTPAVTSALDTLRLTQNSNESSALATSEPQTPQQQARQLQHVALTDRASAMLRHDESKLADFRTSVSSYRTSTISASQLIDTFFALFDVPPGDLGKLIKELAELYENEAKRAGLLKAWNDWRAINEDYPSLPGPSGASSGPPSDSGGKRVLKLKSSTAQSSRSAVSRQGSWGNNVTNHLPNPYPALATASSSRTGNAPAWVSSAPSTGRNTSSTTFKPAAPLNTRNTRITSTVPPTDAFPALPAAAKPNTLMMGLTRGSVRWDDNRSSSSASNAWGSTSGAAPLPSSANSTSATGQETLHNGDGSGKKKGKQGKKQTLYHFG